jgi:hypothetical protein
MHAWLHGEYGSQHRAFCVYLEPEISILKACMRDVADSPPLFPAAQDLRMAVDVALAIMAGQTLVQRLLHLDIGGSAPRDGSFVHQTRSPAARGDNAPDLTTFLSTAVIDVSGRKGIALMPRQ